MSSNIKHIEKLFEVAIKIERKPLPSYYETFLNKLTIEQVKTVTHTLNSCGVQYFVFHDQPDKYIK